MARKYFIVWNKNRTEGYITDDSGDADYTATGFDTGATPTVGRAFREAYADDDDAEDDSDFAEFQIEEITLP